MILAAVALIELPGDQPNGCCGERGEVVPEIVVVAETDQLVHDLGRASRELLVADARAGEIHLGSQLLGDQDLAVGIRIEPVLDVRR